MDEKPETGEVAKKLGRHRRSVAIGCAWALGILLLLISVAAVGFHDAWSPLCNEDQYFDLNSGRHRIVRHLCFVETADRVRGGFAAKLYAKHFGEYPQPCWVKVNTFSLWCPRISPHYSYHSMYYAERKLEEFLSDNRCTDGFERLLVAEFLWSAKMAGDDYPASNLTMDLSHFFEENPPTYPLTEDQFPDYENLRSSLAHLAEKGPSLTPRAYGLDRFPELMQQIPPPH